MSCDLQRGAHRHCQVGNKGMGNGGNGIWDMGDGDGEWGNGIWGIGNGGIRNDI